MWNLQKKNEEQECILRATGGTNFENFHTWCQP